MRYLRSSYKGIQLVQKKMRGLTSNINRQQTGTTKMNCHLSPPLDAEKQKIASNWLNMRNHHVIHPNHVRCDQNQFQNAPKLKS